MRPCWNYIKKYFDFSDQWRTLTGFVEYNNPNLNLTFTKDITKADFTVAIRDSKVYITSITVDADVAAGDIYRLILYSILFTGK